MRKLTVATTDEVTKIRVFASLKEVVRGEPALEMSEADAAGALLAHAKLMAVCKAALAALDDLSGALRAAPDHDVSAAAGAELVRRQLVDALAKAAAD